MIESDSIFKTETGYGQLFAILIAFLINPTLGLIASLMVLINADDDYQSNRSEVVTFLLITAAWISLINITKTIAGDQGVYTRIFLNVPNAGFKGTVFNAWGGTGKEPAFSCLTWLLYGITFGNVRLYYFIISMSIYLFQFFATYKLFKRMDVPKGALICGVLILTFFTQYFVMTLQIIRQMLAGGIVIYALVYRAVEGKNNWLLLLLAVLIHTSAAFLAGLSLVPWFYKWMGIKRIAIVIGCFVPIVLFNGFIGNLFGGSTGISALDYGLEMYGNTGVSDSSGGLQLSIMLMIFVPLTITGIKILAGVKREFDDSEHEEDEEENPILPIVYICFLLLIFVLSFTKSPMVQYRFFYYSYSFIPLILPLLFTKEPLNKIYWSLSSLFFIARFFLTHNNSGWRYASLSDIFSSTIYFFWTGNFHWMYLL